MAWRTIEHGDHQWQVSFAAEQRPSSPNWSLVFCFRRPGQRSVWIPAPVVSPSRAALYIHAERMTDHALTDLLVQTVSQERMA